MPAVVCANTEDLRAGDRVRFTRPGDVEERVVARVAPARCEGWTRIYWEGFGGLFNEMRGTVTLVRAGEEN